MAYTDLREFIAALETARRAEADSLRGGPGSGNHRVRRPRRQARRPRAAVREAEGLARVPVLINALRQHAAAWRSRWRSPRSTRSPRASPSYLEMRTPEGLIGKLKMLPKLAEMGSFFPKTVSERPCKEVIRRDGFSLLDYPILKCWPQDGGRFITLPLVFTSNPDTGKRNCGMYRMQVYDERTDRHALADPQAGRRALPPAAAGKAADAHGRGGRHRRRPGHHVLRHPAAAAGPRRDDDRRLPARPARRDGEVRDVGPGGARQRRDRARRLRRTRRAAHRRPVRRPHRLLLARGRVPGLPRHLHHAAEGPDLRDHHRRARRPWRTTTWARPSSASSCR